jgi:hypothetical protein
LEVIKGRLDHEGVALLMRLVAFKKREKGPGEVALCISSSKKLESPMSVKKRL